MVQEVRDHGRILNMAALNSKGGIEKAAMAITVDNFNPHSFDIRPPAWQAIRLRRAIAKEEVGRTLNDVEYVRNRPMRVIEVLYCSITITNSCTFSSSYLFYICYLCRKKQLCWTKWSSTDT